jgi:hypothetical protein
MIATGAPPAPEATFREYYLNTGNNNNRAPGMIGHLMNYFDPQLPTARPPLECYNAAVNKEPSSSHAYEILQQDGAVPAVQGQLGILHGVKLFPTSTTAPATIWTGQAFGFMGDTYSQNDPQSLTFPVDDFHRVTNTTVTTLRPEVLTIMFNADPALHSVNPPNAHDPGVMNVITRYVMPIPFELGATLLRDKWTPSTMQGSHKLDVC